MGMIREKIKIRSSVDNEWIEVSALIDTGASTSFLRTDIAKRADVRTFPFKGILEVGDSRKVSVEGAGLVQADIQGEQLALDVVVKQDLPEEMVIGANLLQHCDAQIDMQKDGFKMGKCKPKTLRLVSLRMVENA